MCLEMMKGTKVTSYKMHGVYTINKATLHVVWLVIMLDSPSMFPTNDMENVLRGSS